MSDPVDVPLPALGDAPAMDALADAASGDKRPAEGTEEDPTAKRAKYPLPAAVPPAASTDPAAWEALMAQVRSMLRAMTSDECFSRALELQMLARSEVGNRSQHLSNAMDLMAESAPPPVASVPAQMKAARAPAGGTRVTKAEREVSKQKPIKTTKSAPVPCMKMTPPLPPRCEVDNAPGAEMPAFCQLVNFPTARYYGNCVMCDESEFAIPKQNKGVCNNCDVAIWVVNPSGMNIKWCKGCKNFRKWVDFGVKGYSSKCERCRNQQATRYANQKNKEQGGVVGLPPGTGMVAAPVAADPAAVAAAAAAAAAQGQQTV
ncbi:hypothetical protein ACHAXT_002486 [Thalassiosira profunda]